MTRADILHALKITQGKFEKGLAKELKWKFEGSRKKFFLPEEEMPDDIKRIYEPFILGDPDDEDARAVEDVLGNIADSKVSDDVLNAARLDNLKARTALLEQKLQEAKAQIWSEWNEAIYIEFIESFARLKNSLISLHLNADQIEQLNSGIDSALKNLKDRLETLWNKFNDGYEED